MKTTILFAAVLLMSSASFAQTSASANTDAQATVNTNAVSNVSGKTEKEAKKAVQTAKSDKKTVQEQSARISGNTQAEMSSNTTATDNISGKDASINGQSSISSTSKVDLNTQKEGQETTAVLAKTKKSVKSTAVSTDTRAKATVKTLKPKPVAVKANTHVATGAAIRIK